VVREVAEETGFRIEDLRFLGIVRHAYTHFRVVLHAFEARVPGRQPVPPAREGTFRWLSPEAVADLALPEATRKVLQALRPLPRDDDLEDGAEGLPRRERKPSRAARAVQDQAKRSPNRS